jgi:hypothetical protein
MLVILVILGISLPTYANISGKFYSEFKRQDMDCAIEAQLTQKKANQITFKQWDELCEDKFGNSFESSLASAMTYEKIGDKKIKVTQGKDQQDIDVKMAEFTLNRVHYNFEVETEDGHLEINESYVLTGEELSFSSVYILDGKEIINKSGTVIKKK